MRICDLDHASPVTHVWVSHLHEVDADTGIMDPEPLVSNTMDLGKPAADHVCAGDLHALGQLVPAKYRTKKPVATRKPRAGAAPAALAGALSGE